MTKTDPAVTDGVIGALQELWEAVDADGWDQRHHFGFLYVHDLDPTTAAIEARTFYTFSPEQMTYRVGELLERLAEILTGLTGVGLTPPPSHALHGVFVVTEAWTVHAHRDNTEAIARAERASRSRTLHEHPDRVEVRMVNAVDMDGVRYIVERVRGEENYRAGSSADGTHIDGGVFDGLLAVVEAAKGAGR